MSDKKEKMMSFAFVKRYVRNLSGAIAIMFAFMAPAIVGSAGFALDYAMAYLVQQRLAQAIDASALAGAAESTDEAEIESRIRQFFAENYPADKVGFTFEPEVEVVGDEVRVTGNARYDTSFVRILGIDEIEMQEYLINEPVVIRIGEKQHHSSCSCCED